MKKLLCKDSIQRNSENRNSHNNARVELGTTDLPFKMVRRTILYYKTIDFYENVYLNLFQEKIYAQITMRCKSNMYNN